jgi:membrane-bound metal-dependent hydrolase YbcI (DUF457 family)
MADNLTHGLAGALLAQTGLQQRYGPAATVALVMGAELPDLDSLFALGGPVLSFVHHRGMTHSLLGGAGLALLGALLLWRLFRAHPYWRLLLWTYLGVLLHIGMDVLTPYGTQVFWPWTTNRYTANALFILDYFYTGLMVVTLLLIRMVRQQRQRQYGLRSLIGIGVGSALWFSTPRLPPDPWWLLACGTGLFLAVLVVRVVRLQQVSQYRLMSLLGIGVGLGIVLWRMTAAFTRNPALQTLAVQSGGVHLAFFAGMLGLGAWYGRRWHGARSTMMLGRWGVAAVLGYIGLCLVSQTVAQHLFARALGPQLATVERLTMRPLPGWGPVQWRGIAVTRAASLVSRVTLVPPSVTPPEVIAKGPDTPQVRVAGKMMFMPCTGSCRVLPPRLSEPSLNRASPLPPPRHDPDVRSFPFPMHHREIRGFPRFWSKKQRSIVNICIDIPYRPNTHILPADWATRSLV